jgi:hypothetical protein
MITGSTPELIDGHNELVHSPCFGRRECRMSSRTASYPSQDRLLGGDNRLTGGTIENKAQLVQDVTS